MCSLATAHVAHAHCPVRRAPPASRESALTSSNAPPTRASGVPAMKACLDTLALVLQGGRESIATNVCSNACGVWLASVLTPVLKSAETPECASNPCVNGVCQEEGEYGFVCHCSAGYTGTLCDQGVSQPSSVTRGSYESPQAFPAPHLRRSAMRTLPTVPARSPACSALSSALLAFTPPTQLSPALWANGWTRCPVANVSSACAQPESRLTGCSCRVLHSFPLSRPQQLERSLHSQLVSVHLPKRVRKLRQRLEQWL